MKPKQKIEFLKLDKNKNKSLSYQEFAKGEKSLAEKGLSNRKIRDEKQRSKILRKMKSTFKRKFESADKNKDKKINLEEYQEFMAS